MRSECNVRNGKGYDSAFNEIAWQQWLEDLDRLKPVFGYFDEYLSKFYQWGVKDVDRLEVVIRNGNELVGGAILAPSIDLHHGEIVVPCACYLLQDYRGNYSAVKELRKAFVTACKAFRVSKYQTMRHLSSNVATITIHTVR